MVLPLVLAPSEVVQVLLWSRLDLCWLAVLDPFCCYLEGWGRGLLDCWCAAAGIVLTFCSIKTDVCQGMQDSDFAVCKRRESGARRWVEQGLDDVVCAGNNKVGG